MSDNNATKEQGASTEHQLNASDDKPLILITGVCGQVGTYLSNLLREDYTVVGLDRPGTSADITFDISSADSVTLALDKVQECYGQKIAVVIHLAAYFDFSGEASPKYEAVNEKGMENLLKGLADFSVEQFVYLSTMLVNKPVNPGELIDENSPIEAKWAYPESKAKTETILRQWPVAFNYSILRIAGVYTDECVPPTLAHQIARIYEGAPKAHLYAGEQRAGQAMIHLEDLGDAIKCLISVRHELPAENVMVLGETDAPSYAQMQHRIAELTYGDSQWKTFTVPRLIAKLGAWSEALVRPRLPDTIDTRGEPFIKPFMLELSSDHYALNTDKAQRVLGWCASNNISEKMSTIVKNLKRDPVSWYRKNGVAMPAWLKAAQQASENAEKCRVKDREAHRAEHEKTLWAPFISMGIGAWLLTAPHTLGYESVQLTWSDSISAVLIMVLSFISLSNQPKYQLMRWPLAVVGLWVMTAPLLFWAPTSAAYFNGTFMGALVLCLSLVVRPFPGGSPVANASGPAVPPGWAFSPSDWTQRIPIIVLAVIGFLISSYLAAYQLGHIEAIWDPFFAHGANAGDQKNGTEEIITSSVSQAWPVPDAGLGALTYLLEIITGLIGARNRWRTMPWLVLIFGFMIVPLGAVSITFIVIQPIMLGTWCTLCLVAAAAMLLQIPYSFDEIVATIGFLKRRAQRGLPWVKIIFTGDTDDAYKFDYDADNFRQPPLTLFKEMCSGGLTAPWTLLMCVIIGIWLMCTRLTIGTTGAMADADHFIGAMIITFSITAFAEVMRPIRFANLFLGLALFITPFVMGASLLGVISSIVCGAALIGLSWPQGRIENAYGGYTRAII